MNQKADHDLAIEDAPFRPGCAADGAQGSSPCVVALDCMDGL